MFTFKTLLQASKFSLGGHLTIVLVPSPRMAHKLKIENSPYFTVLQIQMSEVDATNLALVRFYSRCSLLKYEIIFSRI